MKPFITDALKDGRYVLPFQCEGLHVDQLNQTLLRKCVVAYAMPDGHSFECAWAFQLIFSDNTSIEFSSACTGVGGWQEAGSLNLRFEPTEKPDQACANAVSVRVDVPAFAIKTISKMIFEDGAVYAECGIVLGDSSGHEIRIAASQSPGSVSVQAPFSVGEFKPEFSPENYRRQLIDG